MRLSKAALSCRMNHVKKKSLWRGQTMFECIFVQGYAESFAGKPTASLQSNPQSPHAAEKRTAWHGNAT